MTGEIDRDFFCGANLYKNGKCSVAKVCIPSFGCDCRHRKHPTPEQYRIERGRDYPNDWAVYCWTFNGAGYSWVVGEYKWAKEWKQDFEPIVCACTPWGKPDNNWRP